MSKKLIITLSTEELRKLNSPEEIKKLNNLLKKATFNPGYPTNSVQLVRKLRAGKL